MVRKGFGRHNVVVTGSNNPSKQVSKDAWNDDIDNTGMFGFSTTSATIVIATGNLTPVDTWTVVESETSPSADDLANILTTETNVEDILFLVGKSGDTITLKHQATGAGQIHILSASDKVLDTNIPTILVRRGTDWYEFGGDPSFTTSSTDTLTNKTLGATTIAGHLIPDTDVAYDLGSTSFKFRDLYLSGSSIKLGDATITASASTIVLPSGSTISGGNGDVVDLNSTQTLTNKTFDADGTGNSITNIENADIKSTAAIDYSKLAALTDGNILVGNGSNVATSVNPSGDIDISNTGVFSIASGVIVNADVNASAAIAYSKLNLSSSIVSGDIVDGTIALADISTAAKTEALIFAVSDETTALTAGTSAGVFRMPYGFTLTAVRASVTTAGTGSVITVDINESGTSILSTKLTIDATEKTSTTAATAAVISDTALADDAEITIDIDTVDSGGVGAGLKVYLIGYQT